MAANESAGSGLQGMGIVLQKYADWVLGLGVLGLMVTLLTPLPPGVLDGLVALNIGLSLLMLLVTMNVRGATELTTFPSVLLFATLFRLGLNVASTRLILTEGKAGTIIQAFGQYVVGDNMTVGMIVFLILIVIQFVVITKGAGRISEVAARFVLDAMPGKQMAIDADLNAGLIEPEQARTRRAEVASEAEFYGAMDGASKFVRGDAIAGLIITALNLLGGIAVGMMQSMSMGEAAGRYSMLTIGDGLVSQIPALFVSTAAAVLVTKANTDSSLGENLVAQVSSRPKATLIAAGMLFMIGLLPAMPPTPFFLLASLFLLTWRGTKGVEAAQEAAAEVAAAEEAAAADESSADSTPAEEVAELLQVDRISLEIGYRLIPLVQDKSGTGILDHVSQLRRRFASREGVVLPAVRIKDNIRLQPNGYRILLGGQEIAHGAIEPGRYMAMDGGGTAGEIRGTETVDPAFGLPARWIGEDQRDEAEVLGYTVIDPTSVLVTHLGEVLREALAEIVSRDDVRELVEGAKKAAPAVVEELFPDKYTYGELQRVLCNLLREGVAVRNVPAILEGIADNLARTRDPDALSELVRQKLSRSLCEQFADDEGRVWAVTLDPEVESRLAAAVGGQNEPDQAPVGPAWLSALVERTGESLGEAARGGREVVVLVRSGVRRFVQELLRGSLPSVKVLSYNEVVPAAAVETLGQVKMDE